MVVSSFLFFAFLVLFVFLIGTKTSAEGFEVLHPGAGAGGWGLGAGGWGLGAGGWGRGLGGTISSWNVEFIIF